MSAAAMRSKIDPRTFSVAPIVAAALVIFGAKLLLIKSLGAQVPYWDQWDGEAAFLYKPYLEGTLTWDHLLASHNEHRIFFSRLWSLVLLELNGVWSPKLQMVANAAVHTAVLGLLLLWFTRGLNAAQALFLCALTALVYAIPFGWGNTLAGFQSQFYFVFGFSMVALWAFSTARPFSLRWFIGVLFSVAAYFSMASGALTLIAVIAFLSLQVVLGIRARSLTEIASVLLLGAVAGLMLAYVTPVPGHDPLKAADFGSFAGAFLQIASWPVSNVALGVVVLNAPIAMLFVKTLMERRPIKDAAWTAIIAMLWLGTQWLSFAYGRAAAPVASRYLDSYTIGIVINCLAALLLFRDSSSRWIGLWFVVGLPLFATAVAVETGPRAFSGAARRHAHYVTQTENLSEFLKSGDIAHLKNKKRLDIPYPDPDRLASIASDPTVRKVLHPRLTGAKVPKRALPRWLIGGVQKAQLLLLKGAPLWLFLGLTLFAHRILRTVEGRRNEI